MSMEKFAPDLYNMSEWALLRLFRVVTGLKLVYNPDLKRISLITLDDVEDAIIETISDLVSAEFEIQIEPVGKPIEYRNSTRGHFLNTSRLTSKLKKILPSDKETALMVVTNYWLSPTPFLLSRILHTIFPILGITYLLDGICYVTTLDGRLTKELIQFAAIHEVGHLLGLHGYPLTWLRKKKNREKEK
ncbi:MAG: hypothetical protein HWN66_02795 [Candidatus Helarchaeota archaeon]|nr:hypothetical protein [Candidatus Helarchaeota archaeon]